MLWIAGSSVPLVEGPKEIQGGESAPWWDPLLDAQPQVQLAAGGLFTLSLFLLILVVLYWRATDPHRVARPHKINKPEQHSPIGETIVANSGLPRKLPPRSHAGRNNRVAVAVWDRGPH